MKNGIYKPASEYIDDGVPCLRMYNIDGGVIAWRDIKRMRLTKHEVAEYGLLEGDLLVNRVNSRELVGKAACIPSSLEPSVFESKNIRVRLDTTQVHPKFINYQLLARGRRYFAGNAQQVVGMASISQGQVADFPIVLTGLNEQRMIVREIERQFSRLDEAVGNLQQVGAALKQYRRAVLLAAIEGRLVETEAERALRHQLSYESAEDLLLRARERRDSSHPRRRASTGEGALPNAQELPPLPQGWAHATADHVCEVVASGSTPKSSGMYAGSGEVPFVKVYNLTTDGSLDFSVKPTFIARATNEGSLARSRTFPGDVLMNIVGPPLGKVSVVPDRFPEWNINQAIVTFRASSAIDNKLLAYWLMSGPILRRLERTAKATAGQFNIQVTTCRRLVLPIPPLAEQRRIVAELDRRLSIVRELEAEVDANLKRAQSLRQAILAKAFSGAHA